MSPPAAAKSSGGTPSGISICEWCENDEPCDEMERAGDGERWLDTEEWRECDMDLPLFVGGRRVPSLGLVIACMNAALVSA